MTIMLWEMTPTIESVEYVDSLKEKNPPKFDWVNRDEVYHYFSGANIKYAELGGNTNPLYYREMPIPKLVITEPTFCVNLIRPGFFYVSAYLRSLMKLPEDSVRYVDVDLSECPESVRAMDYKAIFPLKEADPIDTERSSGRWIDFPGPDGKMMHLWQFGPGGPHAPIPRIYLLEDFVPPAPLFLSPLAGALTVTDELAERVMHAGITNVGFMDPTNDGTQGLRWKMLA